MGILVKADETQRKAGANVIFYVPYKTGSPEALLLQKARVMVNLKLSFLRFLQAIVEGKQF